MNLFYKNRFLDLTEKYKELQEDLHDLRENHDKKVKDYDNLNYSLLSEKTELEKKIVKLETKLELAESKILDITTKCEAQIEIINSDRERLNKENIKLKTQKQELGRSLGGVQTKNNNLQNELGKRECYIDLLFQELQRYVKKVPTMKQLLEYEHTRKSPYKKVEKEEMKNEKVK